MMIISPFFFFFFFNDTATTEIYTLSLHDALPIFMGIILSLDSGYCKVFVLNRFNGIIVTRPFCSRRSEEHTSELQSRLHLVCRLLLEKKKNYNLFPLVC